MARALRLAERGLYTTDPNPRVGCVLVRDGEIVGEGWHERAGLPHAERNALAAAGEHARGATAYVSLEPCCHQGRTPPCTAALIEAGVARVVAAMTDPNPLVSGRGLAELEQHGLIVEKGLLEAQARALNPGFVRRMERGLPYVRCKIAASLDGRTAMASGESKWITSEAARLDVQRMRARSSAILTGIGTVLADDPSLNVRLPPESIDCQPGQVRQPLRVVVDSRLRTPASARMLTLEGETLITCVDRDIDRAADLEAAGARLYQAPAANGRVNLRSLLETLARQKVNEIAVEAGPILNGALLQAGLVDELIVYLAPHLMGDAGRGMFRLLGLDNMSQRIALELVDVRQIGPDIKLRARPRIAPA